MNYSLIILIETANQIKFNNLKLCLLFISVLLSINYGFSQSTPPLRELRGVWIATVKNIDFPSSTKLTSAQQQQEFKNLLDFHRKNGINAVFVQVRPCGDAFYPSSLEPWSEWLNGKQGKAPEPFYDPLEFMIAEAHRRGMEFHAWFNPYRGVSDIDKDSLKTDASHISRRKPEWFLRYGKNLYFDPGNPEVRAFVSEVILDVARRYPVDAIHFDDYFYPYRLENQEFPDSASFQKYRDNFVNKDDWRRNNVDVFVRDLAINLKKTKPDIKFGISPFGVWRNIAQDSLGSKTQAGQTCYDDLYADIRKWLREGWIDYVVPQIYFSIGYPRADYQILLDWWRKNAYGKHLYIGHGAYKIAQNADSNWFKPEQIPQQIQLNRRATEVQGSVYFSAKSFNTNPLQINDKLQKEWYRAPALIPTMDWLKIGYPAIPLNFKLTNQNGQVFLTWQADSKPQGYVVIYRFRGKGAGDLNNPQNIIQVCGARQADFLDLTAQKRKKYTYLIQYLDKLWQTTSISQQYTFKLRGKKKLKFFE
jgi:uncharacterized lipoprotein YddW (UPF0748 family)